MRNPNSYENRIYLLDLDDGPLVYCTLVALHKSHVCENGLGRHDNKDNDPKLIPSFADANAETNQESSANLRESLNVADDVWRECDSESDEETIFSDENEIGSVLSDDRLHRNRKQFVEHDDGIFVDLVALRKNVQQKQSTPTATINAEGCDRNVSSSIFDAMVSQLSLRHDGMNCLSSVTVQGPAVKLLTLSRNGEAASLGTGMLGRRRRTESHHRLDRDRGLSSGVLPVKVPAATGKKQLSCLLYWFVMNCEA